MGYIEHTSKKTDLMIIFFKKNIIIVQKLRYKLYNIHFSVILIHVSITNSPVFTRAFPLLFLFLTAL
jgi:hypothetical protein